MNHAASHPAPIALALGSNLGDAREALDAACAGLELRAVQIIKRSRLYHTRPWGVTNQPPFVNAAVLVETTARPLELLSTCLEVERALGRERIVKWGPRRIDIDLLFYGDLTISTPELTLPHPYIAQRDFVLAPLIDLEIKPPIGLPDLRGALATLPAAERSIISTEPW